MSVQTRAAFLAHFERALTVGDGETLAAYDQAAADHDAAHPDEPSLAAELAAIRSHYQLAA